MSIRVSRAERFCFCFLVFVNQTFHLTSEHGVGVTECGWVEALYVTGLRSNSVKYTQSTDPALSSSFKLHRCPATGMHGGEENALSNGQT